MGTAKPQPASKHRIPEFGLKWTRRCGHIHTRRVCFCDKTSSTNKQCQRAGPLFCGSPIILCDRALRQWLGFPLCCDSTPVRMKVEGGSDRTAGPLKCDEVLPGARLQGGDAFLSPQKDLMHGEAIEHDTITIVAPKVYLGPGGGEREDRQDPLGGNFSAATKDWFWIWPKPMLKAFPGWHIPPSFLTRQIQGKCG